MAPRLFLRDINLTLGVEPLLAGAELSVSPGERIALVGRNGSGKSTLLRIAAGEIAAQFGRAFRPAGPGYGLSGAGARFFRLRHRPRLRRAGSRRDRSLPRPRDAGRGGARPRRRPPPFLGRRGAPRRHRQGVRRRSGAAAARRAHESPRHRRHRMAGAAARRVARGFRAHQPRPAPAQRSHDRRPSGSTAA